MLSEEVWIQNQIFMGQFSLNRGIFYEIYDFEFNPLCKVLAQEEKKQEEPADSEKEKKKKKKNKRKISLKKEVEET